MQYVFEGKYREFRGYVFANGNPVTISDKGTLEAIKRERGFAEYVPSQCIPAADMLNGSGTPKIYGVIKSGCPKCGKVCVKGQFMHNKHCKA